MLTNVVFEGNTGLDAGGGVIIRSNAHFSDCFIRNNTAARFGGGMVITAGSHVLFSNCQIRDNVSGSGGAGVGNIGSGGGVHINDASPTFRGCLITGNQSKFAAGGIFHIGIFGSPYGPALLTLEDTEVSNNISSRYGANDYPAEGGGVHVEDNAVGYLIRARILNNTANTSGGLSAYRARYEITSSTIEGNHAQDPQSVGGFGGGIGLTSNNVSTPFQQAASLLMTDSTVRGNDARIGGGILASGDQRVDPPELQSGNGHAGQRADYRLTDRLEHCRDLWRWNAARSRRRHNVEYAGAEEHRERVRPVVRRRNPDGQRHRGDVHRGDHRGQFGGQSWRRAFHRRWDRHLRRAVADLSQQRGQRRGRGRRQHRNLVRHHSVLCSGRQQPIPDSRAGLLAAAAHDPLVSGRCDRPRSGQSDLYFSTCGGATSTVGAFNTLPSGRASGNTSTVPSFTSFTAIPKVGPSVLSWVVSRASSVTIAGVGTFSGDMGSTLATPATSTTYTLTAAGGVSLNASVIAPRAWGGSTDTAVPGDYDGDGKTDLAVYRPSTGQWFISRSTAGPLQMSWGAPSLGDMPVPADYDGDGKTDIAVFRWATGQWIILNSASGTTTIVSWGAPSLGDVPVMADYDGDHRADIAVYRQSTGDWFIRLSTGGSRQLRWGAPSLGDLPVPQDYDGDGRADIGVYRTTSGVWYISGVVAGSRLGRMGSAGLRRYPGAGRL